MKFVSPTPSSATRSQASELSPGPAVAKYPQTKTQVHAIDFAAASAADYAALGAALQPLDIGVLSEPALAR